MFGVFGHLCHRFSLNERILLANLFLPYKDEISAEVSLHLCAFK
jgi:hypothetical protein